MADSNRTRVGQRERFAENKQAFNDIFGDPFAQPEAIDGTYNRLKRRSVINVQQINDSVADTKNPAKPNIYDFFCDVEGIVDETITDMDVQKSFVETYITEETTTALTPNERMKLEQDVGARLRAYKISPATRYFTVIRQPTGGSAKRKRLTL